MLMSVEIYCILISTTNAQNVTFSVFEQDFSRFTRLMILLVTFHISHIMLRKKEGVDKALQIPLKIL